MWLGDALIDLVESVRRTDLETPKVQTDRSFGIVE